MGVGSSTRALKLNALAQLVAAGGDLHLPTLVLFTNPVIPTTDTLAADLTPPTFTGYTPVVGVVFGTPFVAVDGRAVVAAPSEDFIRTGGAISETIYGWALMNVGLTALYYAEALDVPVPLADAGDGLTIEPIFPYGI